MWEDGEVEVGNEDGAREDFGVYFVYVASSSPVLSTLALVFFR